MAEPLTKTQREVCLLLFEFILVALLSEGDLSPADRERKAALVEELNRQGLGIATLAIEEPDNPA